MCGVFGKRVRGCATHPTPAFLSCKQRLRPSENLEEQVGCVAQPRTRF
ncbi:hypothetical protein [Kingella potus]|nr:hypothetical protein [Kingella potus]UOP00072.1 hypothetical protein LVJ84_08770 [Kingella potus]